jgi:uncharacterized membrane protein YdjX (TVP38/TMEM64 family)
LRLNLIDGVAVYSVARPCYTAGSNRQRPIMKASSSRSSALVTGARVAALAAVAVGIVWATFHRAEFDPAALRTELSGTLLAPLIFLALQVAASLLFVPRSVLGVAAGLIFGMAWGTVWSIAGAILGAIVGFAFARWMGAARAFDSTPAIARLIARAEKGGWRAVAVVRLAPIPHSVANTALAMTRISWRDYIVGSAAGMLPMTLAQVGIGAAGGEFIMGSGGWLIACLLLAATLIASFLLRRMLKKTGEE